MPPPVQVAPTGGATTWAATRLIWAVRPVRVRLLVDEAELPLVERLRAGRRKVELPRMVRRPVVLQTAGRRAVVPVEARQEMRPCLAARGAAAEPEAVGPVVARLEAVKPVAVPGPTLGAR